MRVKLNKSTNDAVGYVRTSTDMQECSIQVQTERIKAYCTMQGLTLVAILTDENVSGKTPIAERPQGSKIAGLLANGASHVVALKLDRLFRNAADALTQCDQWERDGIALHLVDMGGTAVNTKTAMGKMMLTMLAGFAEFERATIAERVTAAIRHKKANGKVYNHVPFGKQRTPDGLLIDHTAEMSVVRRMEDLRASGASYQGIADLLNASNTPSKTGGIWYAKTVRGTLIAEPLISAVMK